MSWFSLEAFFGLDATGVKTGVAEAVGAVDKGSKQMEQVGAKAGNGINTSLGTVRLNAKKTKLAIVDLTQSIANGGDVIGSLGGGLASLGKSAKGSLAIGAGVAIGGLAISSFFEMLGAAEALNKELEDLSTNGMSLSGQTSEHLASQIGALTAKIKESQKSAVGGAREAWEIVNGFFGGDFQEKRQKSEADAEKDRAKAAGSLVNKLKERLAIEEKLAAGDKIGAEMDELRVKHKEKLTELALQLGDTPEFQDIKNATVAVQGAEMKALINKQAKEQEEAEEKHNKIHEKILAERIKADEKEAAEALKIAEEEAKQEEKAANDRAKAAKAFEADQFRQAKDAADALNQQATQNVQNRRNPSGAADTRRTARAIEREKRAIGARERDKADRAARNGGDTQDFLNGGLKNKDTDSFFDTGIINSKHDSFFGGNGPVHSRDFRGIKSHQIAPSGPGAGDVVKAVNAVADILKNVNKLAMV